jgi:hypothetical protein
MPTVKIEKPEAQLRIPFPDPSSDRLVSVSHARLLRAPADLRPETLSAVTGVVEMPLRTRGPKAAAHRAASARRRAHAIARAANARAALPRYLATWTDGVTRVIHAPTHAAASELAARLEVADSVFVVSVKALP